MIYKKIGGEDLPAIGFGTYHLRGRDGVKAIRLALDIGYRHLDTASRYENEEEVGQAIRESGLDRSQIFLTTKLRYLELEPEGIEQRTRESLARLGVDHVDLLMPHWPSLTVPVADFMPAFVRVKEKGLARRIGVSNFPLAHMRDALAATDGAVVTNQVEYHPFLSQQPMLSLLRERGMLLTAAVPLARGAIEDEPVLREIGEAHGKSPGQVALRWLIQQDGVIAIPKSARPERIMANFSIFDFALSDAEMARIDALRGGRRLVDPHWAPVWDQPG